MSDYGADPIPDLGESYDLQFTKSMITDKKTNVMQWTYPGYRVQKLANKQGKSNLLIKFNLP